MGEPARTPEPQEPQRSAAPEPQKQLPTSGLAIASLVLFVIGIFAFAIILGPLAIIFGTIGIFQVSGKRRRGLGLAIAGVVLGAIETIVAIFVIAQFF